MCRIVAGRTNQPASDYLTGEVARLRTVGRIAVPDRLLPASQRVPHADCTERLCPAAMSRPHERGPGQSRTVRQPGTVPGSTERKSE